MCDWQQAMYTTRSKSDAGYVLRLLQDQMNNVAKFLESRGMPEQALEVATDADYRFELAVQVK